MEVEEAEEAELELGWGVEGEVMVEEGEVMERPVGVWQPRGAGVLLPAPALPSQKARALAHAAQAVA